MMNKFLAGVTFAAVATSANATPVTYDFTVSARITNETNRTVIHAEQTLSGYFVFDLAQASKPFDQLNQATSGCYLSDDHGCLSRYLEFGNTSGFITEFSITTDEGTYKIVPNQSYGMRQFISADKTSFSVQTSLDKYFNNADGTQAQQQTAAFFNLGSSNPVDFPYNDVANMGKVDLSAFTTNTFNFFDGARSNTSSPYSGNMFEDYGFMIRGRLTSLTQREMGAGTEVPEPATPALLALAAAGLLAARRKKR